MASGSSQSIFTASLQHRVFIPEYSAGYGLQPAHYRRQIKIKQGVEIEKSYQTAWSSEMEQSLQQTSLFSHITGNEPIIANGVSIFGEEIKEKIGSKIWGMDEEGDSNNVIGQQECLDCGESDTGRGNEAEVIEQLELVSEVVRGVRTVIDHYAGETGR
ncbi:hypothetical protein B0H14DRAFT_2562325 [Mycena olivaceomarginata]|nr:hypothetical protein B0H14DRAFT_2562325 [Mycena olivaceomarginata]